MRTLFCNLLCASLLIHALLGCCWHDAHEAVAGEGSHVAIDADSDCCHNHDGATGGHDSHAPCKGHPNCHGLCHYLPVQKTSFDKCLDYVVIDFVVDAQATSGSQASAFSFAAGTCEFSSSAAGAAASLSSNPLDLIALDSCIAAIGAARCAVDAVSVNGLD